MIAGKSSVTRKFNQVIDMNTVIAFLVSLFVSLSLGGGAVTVWAAEQPKRLRVMTTLFPYYDWAGIIGGDQVEAVLLLPPGVEAHSFDPTPKDIARLKNSDIFIYTGRYMEPWADDLVTGAVVTGLGVVEAGALVELIGEDDGHHHHHGHGEKKPDTHGAHGKHGDGHGTVDPHIWLEFTNAAKIVLGMARAFAEKDPKNGELYKTRAQAYGDSLRELDQRYAKTLETCRQRTIIYGGHFAFGYAAKRYKLKHISPYKGFSPNAEPSPRDVAELTRRMKKEGHSHIFFEEGIEPKVARVISGETGAKMLLLHGAHNLGKKELEQKVTYLSLMNDNLERLQEGLQCR
jgi:zinc transport system substrate-binding protein